MWSQRERTRIRVLSSLICHLIASKKHRYTRLPWRRIWTCLGFSSSVTSQRVLARVSLLFYCLVQNILSIFVHLFPLALFFTSSVCLFVIHPCNLFFQGLKIRITYSDLIGSVVQIYLCQYFHWPHHRKQLHCIFENSIYVSEWNTFVFLIRCLLVYKRKLQKVFVKGLRIILEMIQTLPC